MAKQLLGIGASANDNTGDTLRTGGDKINDNFNELYSALGTGTSLQVNISSPTDGHVLKYDNTSAAFVSADFSALTSNLNVNGNSIVATVDANNPTDPVNIDVVAPATYGRVNLNIGSQVIRITDTEVDCGVTTKLPIKYSNEYSALSSAPAATVGGYFFTVNGDDNPYVNMNITAGGVGDVRAKLVSEYSSIDILADVDTTTNAPLDNQVLKWSSSSSKWLPADDTAGTTDLNSFANITADTGTTTANSNNDTLTITGGTNITTSITGDTVTIDFSGTLTTTLAALTDTDTTGITQGDSLYWNGTDWVVTRSPIIWWELGANGASDFTFSGPGFTGTVADPTIKVYRGFTYAFDNSVESTNHPFRIQSTAGLSGNPYTAGQTGSGTSVLYWTVPMDAPGTLYYQCTIHSQMNGTITVVG